LFWSYLDAAGSEVARSESFPDRKAAEAWITASWEDLLDDGYEAAALIDVETGDLLYRMGLGPEP
jgi:hypothetical protein